MTQHQAQCPVTLAILSWKSPATLINSLTSYERGGILPLFAERLLFFNEITDNDRDIAARFGFQADGSRDNLGIFGGVEALFARAASKFVLFLENDLILTQDRETFTGVLGAVIADMEEEGLPYIYMRSRRQPGEPFWRRAKYEKYFRIAEPLDGPGPDADKPRYWRWTNLAEDLRRPKLRGCAIYAEERPDLRHPGIIRRTKRGTWVTDSRWLSWSNCGFMGNRDFVRDVVLDHVRNEPAKTLLNGRQDIEASLKRNNWWARQKILMGQADPGPFTHIRLDR